MKKHLRSVKNIKEQEKDINNIIPDIIFLYSIIKEKTFVDEIKEELMSFSEINSIKKLFLHIIFLLLTSPIWFISGLFNLKYNEKYFSRFFRLKFIYTEYIKENQKKVFERYNEEIKKYNEIVNKDNCFTMLKNLEYKISKENFNISSLRNEVIIEIDDRFKKLYLSFEKNPEYFTEYFNIYINAKGSDNKYLNFIAKSLNEHILKNSIERNKKKELTKLNKADIIYFNKKKK